MWRLADGAVDRNSPYSYLMLCEYFADTCAVATIDEHVVGFATGFRLPHDADTLFLSFATKSSLPSKETVSTGCLIGRDSSELKRVLKYDNSARR